MQRRLLDILAATSLLLSAAVVALWVQSYVAPNLLGAIFDEGSYAIRSADGRLEARHCRQWGGPANVRIVWDRRALDQYRDDPRPNLVPPQILPPPASVGNGFGFARANTQVTTVSAATGVLCDLLTVPYWFVTMVCAAPMAGRLAMRKLAANRLRCGHCLACGYDLRATPLQCPECGMRAGHTAAA
jgi:hypothetical protein